MKKNEHIFLKACKREPVERTPVWIMRQAGRYLPEYRKVRERADFMTLCKTPDLAAEVTVQPIDILGLDAAIIFSDILVIPEAMGMKLDIIESKGPVFDEPLKTAEQIIKLNVDGIENRLTYVYDAVKETKKRLDNRVPLIGFAGSPWTLATYMVEGGSSKNFDKIKKFIYSDLVLAHKLLNKIADAVIKYLNEKIKAGCDAVQIFDTWAGILSPWDYEEFSLKYIKQIIEGLDTQGKPVIVFSKGATNLKDIAESGCNVIGIDWTYDIGKVRNLVGETTAIQGNLDPLILFAPHDTIKENVRIILDKFGKNNGHIFNLGHGILPKTPVENVKYLIQTLKDISPKYH